MERRSENEQREIRKIAKKKAIAKAVILGVSIFAFFGLCLLLMSLLGAFIHDSSKMIRMIELLINFLTLSIVIAILAGIFIIYPYQIEKETKKKSVVFVANSLIKDSRVEVIPVEAPLRYYMFLTKELPSLGNFYAKLRDNSYVTIEFKLENDSSYHFVENIEKEKFTYYYELKTETKN